jgi:hypothetical protein
MSENKIAFKQEKLTEQDYQEFEKKLFSNTMKRNWTWTKWKLNMKLSAN